MPPMITSSPNLELLHNGRLLIFVLTGNTRTELDNFTNTIVEQVKHWDHNKPWLVAYDGSKGQVTPYSRDRLRFIGDQIPLSFHGRTAVILPDGIIFSLIRHLVKRVVPVENQRMQRQFFISRTEAIQWLEQGLG